MFDGLSYAQAIAKIQEQDFDTIIERMLDRVPAHLDKREGGVIWNALAPAAAEVTQSYMWLEAVFDLVFADTASGEFLEKRAAEAGIERQPATKAVWQGLFNRTVPVGTRFYLDPLYFVTLEGDQLQCETPGDEGNANLTGQTLQALDTIPGLETASMGDQLVPARAEENDDELYQRYLVRVRREAVSGNAAHYKTWAESFDGVGHAKVFPLWNGPGTVKIVITNSNMQPASPELLNLVKVYIDPEPGRGEGQAPIGAVATIESAVYKVINIQADVLPSPGRTLDDVRLELTREFEKLFSRISFQESIVRLSQVNNIVFNAVSVSDYGDIRLNNAAENLDLADEEIPQLGEVIINEQV